MTGILKWREYIAGKNAKSALADAETLWRLGRHLTHQPNYIVPHLTGLAILGLAKEITVDLLAADICTPQQLDHLQAMLESLPPEASPEDLMTVEFFVAQEFADTIPLYGLQELAGDAEHIPMSMRGIDPNDFARRYTDLRKECMQYVLAGEYDKAEEQVKRINNEFHRKLLSALTVRGRSEICADILYSLMTPAVCQVFYARQRAERGLELCRITTALKRYQAANKRYPKTLDLLVPEYLSALPEMPDAETYPLSYRRKNAGFILAAVTKEFDPESTKDPDGPGDTNFLFVVKMEK